MEDQGFYDYLLNFVSEERQNKIDEVLESRTRHVALVLEDVYYPQNASAVIRSCECHGVQDIYVVENDKKFRPNTCIAQGASKWLDIHRFNGSENNTLACFEKLKSEGYTIAATCLEAGDALPLNEVSIDNKLAICFGAEETGLSEIALEHADIFMKIPMCGFTQSFNISVSAGICLNNLTSRLRDSQTRWELTEEEKHSLRNLWIKKSVKNWKPLHRRYLEDLAKAL